MTPSFCPPASDARWRTILVIAIQAAAVFVVAIATWPWVAGANTGDLDFYRQWGQRVVAGELPYVWFPFEYPPLAALSFIGPLRLAGRATLSLEAYAGLFAIQSVVLGCLTAWAVSRIAASLRPDRRAGRSLILYGLLLAVITPVATWRFDLFPALLSLLAVMCLLEDRPTWSGIWLGAGIAAKLYPAVLLPVFVLQIWISRPRSGVVKLLAGCAGVVGLTLLPFICFHTSAWTSFLRYHTRRGLQLESIGAGLLSLGHLTLGWPMTVAQQFGAKQMVTPLADSVLRVQPVIMLAVFVAIVVLCARRFRRERATLGRVRGESVVDVVALSLLAFMLTGKVFSPQYLVWLIPFAATWDWKRATWVFVVCILTMMLYPFGYTHLVNLETHSILLLNLRNLVALGIMAKLTWRLRPANVQRPIAHPVEIEKVVATPRPPSRSAA